jgi:hypothetical protein
VDYTGAKRDGEDEESIEHAFFRQVCEDLIARVHPVERQGPRGASSSPRRHEIISSWRLAGYRFATHLLPVKHVRTPEELRSFVDGLEQRLNEYELEHESKMPWVEASGEVDWEKIESKAQKFLRLATHAGTPLHEATAASAAIVKMIVSGDLSLLSFERVHDLVWKYKRLKEAFKVARLKNPSDYLYGTREQREDGERNR